MFSALMSTEKITNRLRIIVDIKEDIKKVKAEYDENLEEDDNYLSMQEENKKAREELKIHKMKMSTRPVIREYEEHLKELRLDLKENKEILARELIDYYRETGKLEIVDKKGNTKKIKFSVQLVNG